jgi:hypothetical protein
MITIMTAVFLLLITKRGMDLLAAKVGGFILLSFAHHSLIK